MEKADDAIRIKKESIWKFSTFALGILVIVMCFFIFGGDDTFFWTTGNVVSEPELSANDEPSEVGAEDDAFLGDENAPVTVVEFSDFQCSFCARFWSETLGQLKSKYIETGKVKFVYRDFPLTSIHQMALPAAEAAECVREQGGDEAFWEMHDKIFGNQNRLSQESLREWAQEIGYDIDVCLRSGKFRGEIQKDARDARTAGAGGTPYFLINGKALSMACPFNAFSQAIDAELAGKNWESPGNCQVVVE
ncbi:MAG: DsbA family protein [Nanoarchaeota archaeon]|nr:DsbA family protein [Nanoarchaeota archaeon]